MTEESKPTIDRRRFLTVLGASGGGAIALSGCSTGQVEKLIPYLVQSEDQVPGVATWYFQHLHRVRRPVAACTCAPAKAARSSWRATRSIRSTRGSCAPGGRPDFKGSTIPGGSRVRWHGARTASSRRSPGTTRSRGSRASSGPAGNKVAVISGAGRGTFSDLLGDWVRALGGRLARYETFGSEPLRAANRQVFGLDQVAAYDFARAKYIVSFGADFLDTGLASMENARGFARSHGFAERDVAKFVYLAPRMDLTGLNADQWHPIRPGSEAALALAMANLLLGERGARGEGAGLRAALAAFTPEMAAQETGLPVATIQQLAREFGAARPSLAVAGGVGSQHAGATEVCAAVNILNYVAGNIGETVRFGADLDTGDGYGALQTLLAALDAGQVDVAIVHEANPAYTLPRTSGFAAKFQKAGFKVSTSMYLDETSALCDLLLPQHHPLERWDDLRPRAGVYSLMQPVMEPVFNTMATGDLLLRTAKALGGPLARFTAPSYKEHLQARWQALAAERREKDFAAFWHGALQRGGVFTDPPAAPRVRSPLVAAQVTYTKPAFEGDGQFVFATYAHWMLYDGRGANKPWLLENSDPVTKITWHSWVEVHPDTARKLDLRDGEILRVTSPHGSIEAPVFVYQGIHPDVVAVPLGLGHTEYGAYARGRGVNALDLLGAPAGDFLPYISTRVSLEKTGGYRPWRRLPATPASWAGASPRRCPWMPPRRA